MGTGPICKQCGTGNPVNAKFCMNDGARLTAECTQCHYQLSGNEKFCPNCGNVISAGSPESRTKPVETQSKDWTERDIRLKFIEVLSKTEHIQRQFKAPNLKTATEAMQCLLMLNEIMVRIEDEKLPPDLFLFLGKVLASRMWVYARTVVMGGQNLPSLHPDVRQYLTDSLLTVDFEGNSSEEEKNSAAKSIFELASSSLIAFKKARMPLSPLVVLERQYSNQQNELNEAVLPSLREEFYLSVGL